MSTEIKVPTLGESVTEATIGQWFKKPGDRVELDETIAELETDKVTVEVPAPAAGVLEDVAVQAGETVGVGAVLGSIGEGDGSSPAPEKPKAAEAKAETAPETKADYGGGAAGHAVAPAGNSGDGTSGGMSPAPSAKKIMDEKGLSDGDVEGSGRRGQVLKGDVLDAIGRGAPSSPQETPKAARAPSSPAEESREERVKMTRLRQTIARRLKEAQDTAAMLTTFNEVDMTAVMELRKKYKDLFENKHGVKLGFMGFFTKAVCHALKEIPAVNAEIDGTDLVYKNYAHIGVAVGTPKGLVVPVVRDADQMTIAEIEKEIGRLGLAARDGKLAMADMQGGTFTISNGGVYGSLMSTPILNAPQSGILGMHKIQERPVAIGGQVVIRPMMYLALSYDHRIVDGKEAVTFLVRVKDSLEDPERLVLDL
ncbi:2-oxoglutarate dehydrogenase complex dihydrolipoyllysine-residue succinyltransferase [Aurantimonas endophytica]|uniref:Dihydrolipoyllysine-residue succinyltransferase component of 2-oxoglutarate dehydrogenase complex n=1 Tax=Aurantimonas endophytica TaxID=1522175 RepID=A0A7W6HH13_9HYPH|nr:2-oxoglutarate dehydrogenase complex dihydrolipoyllysine-residue succinyltransferase [Aurantimonas endophytica]MBB4005051.1 2-oxoglutarate dehydrogenase E2 component (dihydrolipoamide succinyltransferase) [Aurantimonas endophytica]MCO6406283.1 2-oxoglutarate dehydrogenase complex dihydrolipoyllysine-residue succinyltransferase [Aurantimonas endophytica]